MFHHNNFTKLYDDFMNTTWNKFRATNATSSAVAHSVLQLKQVIWISLPVPSPGTCNMSPVAPYLSHKQL